MVAQKVEGETMREAKTLTADEIAAFRGRRSVFTAEEGNRMFATIEQQAEQIEKLRGFALDVTRDPLNAKYELAREVLAAMEPPAQIAADLLNAVTDLVDERVFGDAASRDKAERIIGLVLTSAIAIPERDAIRKMVGDLRWQGSALCSSAADMIEALAATEPSK